MTKLRITLLHDAIPGHLNQSRGLAAMLARQHEIDVRECRSKIKWPLARKLYRQLCQSTHTLALDSVIHSYQMEFYPRDTDVLVSFGGDMAPLNIALSKQLHCRNVLIGSLRGIDPKHVCAHLSLNGGSHTNAIATGIAPTTMSPERCQQASTELRQRLGHGRYWSCFIGGDGCGYQYCENDWRQLAEGMNTLAEAHGIQWLIATSRRTGDDAEDFLQQHVDVIHIGQASYYGLTGAEDIAAILGCSEKVFCSADSLTMLSEAITSGRPTIALQPKRMQPPLSHRNTLQTFSAQGYLQLTDIETLARWQAPKIAMGLDYPRYCQRIVEPLQQLLLA